jgi:iron complex transport system substrate-binding protein
MTLGWDAWPSQKTTNLEVIRNEILSRPGAGSISAVKNGRVYVLYWDMCYGMDSVVGLNYLAKIFHPQLNLDLEGVYREYLEKVGLEYPEGREFVFPGIEG